LLKWTREAGPLGQLAKWESEPPHPFHIMQQMDTSFACCGHVVNTIALGAVAICVGMIPALSSGINLSDHAARSMI